MKLLFNWDIAGVAHLSAQFKKVTGLTPTHFKNGWNSSQNVR